MSQERIQVRYSESFKMQVISELESGKFSSAEQARIYYGISGSGTIRGWIDKYGRNDLRAKVIRVERPDEVNQIKQLKTEIKQLKEALADTHVDGLLYKAHFEIVCKQMGLDPEECKKKIDIQLQNKPSRVRQPIKRKK